MVLGEEVATAEKERGALPESRRRSGRTRTRSLNKGESPPPSSPLHRRQNLYGRRNAWRHTNGGRISGGVARQRYSWTLRENGSDNASSLPLADDTETVKRGPEWRMNARVDERSTAPRLLVTLGWVKPAAVRVCVPGRAKRKEGGVPLLERPTANASFNCASAFYTVLPVKLRRRRILHVACEVRVGNIARAVRPSSDSRTPTFTTSAGR